MVIQVDPHVDDETMEQYSMNRLSARSAARVEEHLLICERCRRNLKASDAYVKAMTMAASAVRGGPPNRPEIVRKSAKA